MTFTFPILLGGLLLVAIPVLLHLLMRQKPKTILFPAFRFLVQKSRTNLTKLRLRHLLLLALRMLLLACIVFALARPKLRENPWSLSGDRPLAALLVFDTSASMEYTVAAIQTRLKDAQKRGQELLDLLPANSEIIILDSAETTPIGQGDWLTHDKAAERIGQLALQPSSGPVSARVATALEFLARLAGGKDEAQRSKRPRLLCVFSDQTIASWDAKERGSLLALANNVPPIVERLEPLRTTLIEQEKLFAQFEERLPSISQSFPTQVILGLLDQTSGQLYQAGRENYPDSATQNLLSALRGKQQELLALLDQETSAQAASKDYYEKLRASLEKSLRLSAGFKGLYFDVGIERPVDLAINDLLLTRELSANGGAAFFKLLTTAQATGEDIRTTLSWHLGSSPKERVLEAKKGQREHASLALEADKTRDGYHQAKLSALPVDQLPINNSRYLTYAFRPVLVLTDQSHEADARFWASALQSNNVGAAWYRSETKKIADIESAPGAFDKYAAVFLYAVKDPSEKLWTALTDYVGKGGGLGVIPPAKDSKLKGYNDKAAQEILPGQFEEVIQAKPPGADWAWTSEIFKHPMLHPFQEWRQGKWDFVVNPRKAKLYWKVAPRKDQSQVLVRYADGSESPALVERVIDLKRGRPGRVLLFTSPPGWSEWNDYADNSFYLTLAWRALGYLAGDDDRPSLNFISGEAVPRVPVPIRGSTVSYKLYRDGASGPAVIVASVTAEQGQNEVRLPQATGPGNYNLHAGDDDAVAWFSVNLPAVESDLAKIDKKEIEAALGPDAVIALDSRADLEKEMHGHVSNAWELMPLLMLALLFLLALENLLANKFYRREPVSAES